MEAVEAVLSSNENLFLRALPASEEKRSMVIQQDVRKQNSSLSVCVEDGELSRNRLFRTGSEAFALRYFHASFLFKGCRGNIGYWVFMLSGLSLLLSPPRLDHLGSCEPSPRHWTQIYLNYKADVPIFSTGILCVSRPYKRVSFYFYRLLDNVLKSESPTVNAQT